jgi:Protein of unknown function (DUF3300)
MSAIAATLRTRRLPRKLAVVLVTCGVILGACNKTPEQAATPTAAPTSAAQTGITEPAGTTVPAPGAPAPAAAAPESPAPAVTEASWSPSALEQLVAPIALYPDQLVGQILAASVNSQEVLDGGNWLLQNETLKGNDLDTAAQKAGFGPAMRALVQFPTVVDMMCQQIDWTRQLGSAFTSDQKAVLEAVQRLRTQAAKVGNLKSTPEQRVETKTENQATIIEIQPTNPQVVYVPQYNPQVVYTTPPPPPPPAAPVDGTVSTGTAVAGALLAFGVGVLIGNAISSNDNCYPHWGTGVVFVGPRPFYPPAYVYRPVYGPAFRPAYRYAPPPNYRYGYNNVNFNRNVNVNVNNNYFNQFNQNRNLSGQTQNNFSRATQNNLSGATRNNAANWKGQSTYAGARNTAGYAGNPPRVGGAGGTRNPALAGARTPSSASAGARTPPSAFAANGAASAGAGSNRGRAVDRGYGGSNLGGAGNSFRPAQSSSASRPAGNARAFSGATNPGSGGFDRAASARGHASAGTLSGAKGRGRFGR